MPDFDEEAEACRRQALAYLGRPEAQFLLRVARGFEQLAAERIGISRLPSPNRAAAPSEPR